MSEQAGGNPPVFLPHITSNQYQEIFPSGYLFTYINGFVRQIFYREQSRVVGEQIAPDGSSVGFQVQNFRVQEISVTVTIEDFIRNMARNAASLSEDYGEMLKAHGITYAAPKQDV